MSNLNKFEPTEAWFSRLRSFLLRDSQTDNLNHNSINAPEKSKAKQDISLKMQEDKENIALEALGNLDISSKKSKQKIHIDDDESALTDTKFNTKTINFAQNDTFFEEPSLWRQTTDDSFEFLEKIYDKTIIADMNNTVRNKDIHKLNSDNIAKEVGDITKMCLADQTQLNDIEAPSILWENSLIQTSPVKMVGLLRPSTILEESRDDVSEINSISSDSISFKTVSAKRSNEILSDQYQSANDTFKTDNTNWQTLNDNSDDNSSNTVDSLELLNSNKSTINTKRKFYDDTKIGLISPEQTSRLTKISDSPKMNLSNTKSNVFFNDSHIYKEFSNNDLDTNSLTFQSKFNNTTNLTNFDEPANNTNKSELKKNLSESVEILDDENESGLDQGFITLEENNPEDDIDSIENDSLDCTLNDTSSHEFNDTIEEMEYIMQKGMMYMTATGTTPKKFENSDFGKNSKQQQPTPSFTNINDKITAITTSSKRATGNPNKENKNKEPSFKIPTISKIPQSKQITSNKKQPTGFKYVVSPVGAYIKNTPVTPILASNKPKSNLQSSRIAKGLEFGINRNNFSPSNVYGTKTNIKDRNINEKVTCSLPKKAYISSEYKHYVDERTPIKIPGGNKIHKYLESAKLPAIIKHDGRLKLNDIYSPNEYRNKNTRETINRTVDSSIADLSVVSGDISLLTIKDAQKFGHK